ncbi:MAG TPA: NAD-dependent epimerase/dehydratase family protein [Ktedonobacterales bacterium]|nr:NAD-dependent epimerase/dehydratase family protein [Ktedonobacterales bacterium]
MDWTRQHVLVTGGASFIGSHLVDALIARDVASLRVVDDLSSGKLSNIQGHLDSGRVELLEADLLMPRVAQMATAGVDVVFHLAAIHGGRGFVDLHNADCAKNLALDGMLIKAAHDALVSKFVFASSGCIYPLYLQTDPQQELYLTEDMAGPPFDADNMYGWAKLMAEETLRAYHRDYGFKSVSCRFFTVYGERGIENHAVMAMIARAFLKQSPFEVWGDGRQVRNWTHVSDIVRGMILCAEKVDDGAGINLGTEERIRVVDAVKEVLAYTGHRTQIRFRPDMPVGPLNRVASNRLARERLGWEPRIRFVDGLHRTIDWYYETKSSEQVAHTFSHMLTGR